MYPDLCKQLADFGLLRYDWDQDGALPITREAIRAAQSFLHALNLYNLSNIVRIDVTPAPNGGVDVSLEHESIMFDPSGSIADLLYIQNEHDGVTHLNFSLPTQRHRLVLCAVGTLALQQEKNHQHNEEKATRWEHTAI